MKERLNIKNSVYMNQSMNQAVLDIAEKNECTYQKTIRYLIEKGIETYNKRRTETQ